MSEATSKVIARVELRVDGEENNVSVEFPEGVQAEDVLRLSGRLMSGLMSAASQVGRGCGFSDEKIKALLRGGDA